MTTTSLEQQTHILLKVNVRLNILNTNEIIRQKEQSLVLKVPVEQLTNQATLDINLDDGVELANIDILEMDQELELAEIDIIKLDNDDSLGNKISEALSLNSNNNSQNVIENTQLIDKLANDWSEAQLKYQKEEEFKHEQERKLKELVEEIQEEEQQQVEEEAEEIEEQNIKPRLENNLKLEKILEEEEFTFNSSTEAEWEEEIEWEEEEAEWEDTNYDDSEEKPSESLEDSIQEIKHNNTNNNNNHQNQPIISSSQENSLDYYDEEEEYFTDLDHDKNITNLSSSVDEWEDFSFNLGQLSQLSSATTTTTNTFNTNTKNVNRKNNSIEENIEDKRLLNLIENLFQLIDNDQNGMIDFNDIIRVVFILNYLLGRNYSQSDAIIFFNELDKDKDGRLNRNEFQNAFDFMFFS